MPRTHAALPRLFIEPNLARGTQILLGKDQSLYLAAVLRKVVGDQVVVFNGRDGAWLAQLASDSKKSVTLDLLEQVAEQTPPSDLWYGFAPLKSERLDYVIQKAVEMGAGTIQPVTTRFTQVHRLNPDKLAAYALEAAEQCEILNLPVLAPEIGLDRLLDGWTGEHGDRVLLFADESAPSGSPLGTLRTLEDRRIGLLVGPEGGFAAEERARLLGLPFVVPISLGPRILRADTAAVAALAAIQASIGDWR